MTMTSACPPRKSDLSESRPFRAATDRERMAIKHAEGIRSLAFAALNTVVIGQFSCAFKACGTTIV